MTKVAIGSIMKQEAPYILEWVSYHKALGFELIIADNGGEDKTSQILSALHQAKMCTRIDFRSIKKTPQIPAYRAILRLAKKKKIDIIGFLDCDEFFTRYFPIKSLDPCDGAKYIATEFERKNATQISYHWICYGSKTNHDDISLPVLERFSHHSKFDNRNNVLGKSFVKVKEIFNPSNIFFLGPKILTVHHFHDANKQWYFDGEKLYKFDYKNKIITHREGAILHFPIKTWEEFQKKSSRGRADIKASRYTDDFFRQYDNNDIYTTIEEENIDQVKININHLSKSIHIFEREEVKRKILNDIKIQVMSLGLSDITNHFIISHIYNLYKRIRRYL